MSEVLWWKKENWYEAKTIPLLSFMVSPMQIIFIFGFGLLGLLISIFIPLYYAKMAVVLLMVVIGAVLSSLPAKVVPFELALLYSFSMPKASMKPLSLSSSSSSSSPSPSPQAPKPVAEEMLEVEEEMVSLHVPFTITGELKVSSNRDVSLFVDNKEKVRATVTPSNPRYRLYYFPEEQGVHDLEVQVNGKTLRKVKVNVK